MSPSPTPPTPRPYILLNTFVPAAGRIEEFLDRQLADGRAVGAVAAGHGWRGNRIYRTLDGCAVLVVTVFDSAADHEAWLQRDGFRQHIEHIGPLLDDVRSVPCELVAANGSI